MERSEILNRARELSDRGPAAAGGFPPWRWVLGANYLPGNNMVIVPYDGTLWVEYVFGDVPARIIEVWHQAGGTTPIMSGQNNIPVKQSDLLIYALSDPGQDWIQVSFQML